MAQHMRRVGTARPSHLMFTGGVGALVDLPNFAALVRGLDDWRYDRSEDRTIDEPRLVDAAVRYGLPKVAGLRGAPWLSGGDLDPGGEASRVGVPVAPFPSWMRCTRCDELLPITPGGSLAFRNDNPYRADEAEFVHTDCGKVRGNRKPLAVTARFLLACTRGHLDEFPYREFVHHGGACAEEAKPALRMTDLGGNLGADVRIECLACSKGRLMREAMGVAGQANLPLCRGRHPHLSVAEGCDQIPKVLVVGASNQWFPQVLRVLSVPPSGASELASLVDKHWSAFENMQDRGFLLYARDAVPVLKQFARWDDDAVWTAVEEHRAALAGEREPVTDDLLAPEWEVLADPGGVEPTMDFTARRAGVADELAGLYADVVQVERLREVRALTGFTRLDAPDPEEPELVVRAPLARGEPTWLPAADVRGEGVFVRLPEELMAVWEGRVSVSDAMEAHRAAYRQFRTNRYSARVPGDFDAMHRWPGERYLALHTLSHLLIRTIALECGYNAASLAERIYAGADATGPRAGILIYTAVPDADGTLGGLVSLAEQATWRRITTRALTEAMHCSCDPLCAERLPSRAEDFLHGAACHACLFASETSCERGNRFLDRRFVVPIDDPSLALLPELP